jgi:cell division protein FtsI (penicillin-binding protein 3)
MAGNRRKQAGGQGDPAGFERLVARGSSRAAVVFVFFIILALYLGFHLVKLQVVLADEYTERAREQRERSMVIEPRRGTIYDRNGNILAISVDATTIYANPAEIESPLSTCEQLASVLGGKTEDYLAKLENGSATFAYIKQKADVAQGDAVAALNLPGIYLREDTRREYPYGQVGGQVIGGVNVAVDEENNREYYVGSSGLELYYNTTLAGTPGYYGAELGADGTPIPGGVYVAEPAIEGQDIVLSIDIEFQKEVERALEEGVKRVQVTSGSAVVMDGGTGEIYAAASLPLYNPADRREVKEGSTQLKCVSNLFEPGSIFKTVSAMALLETDSMHPDDTIFCPSEIEADGYIVSDAHDRGSETMSLRHIINVSSNVGISLAVEQRMGFQQFYDHILAYKLNELAGVDYPGEQLGYLLDFDRWSKVAGYNACFGQGISVNAMQVVRFYGALVNEGVACTPHFLIKKPQTGEVPQYPTVDIVENKAAIPEMTSMLQTVITDGTGSEAAIEGFDVAGKTSTAEIFDEVNGGYRDNAYTIAFTGFLANSNSKLVCFVNADEVPADRVVTPTFQDIMACAIDRYNITAQ